MMAKTFFYHLLWLTEYPFSAIGKRELITLRPTIKRYIAKICRGQKVNMYINIPVLHNKFWTRIS
jgi:hypothetical protein